MEADVLADSEALVDAPTCTRNADSLALVEALCEALSTCGFARASRCTL